MLSSNHFPCLKRKKQNTDVSDSDSDDETRTKTGFWPSWLVLEAADESLPLSGIKVFARCRAIKGITGTPKGVKELKTEVT